MICPICHKPFEAKHDTGRPPLYCSARCKGKAKRRAMRDRDRAAILGARSENYGTQEPSVDQGGDVDFCHVCGQHPATVGTPKAILCAGCARAA